MRRQFLRCSGPEVEVWPEPPPPPHNLKTRTGGRRRLDGKQIAVLPSGLARRSSEIRKIGPIELSCISDN
jgi:hypothetical protein